MPYLTDMQMCRDIDMQRALQMHVLICKNE